jgi:hypothetical protein
MGFLTPWFLAGVAALGLPVWLHLLRKHKTTPLPFGSLMFFEKRTQSSIKHRRLRYFLLFSLRTLLLLLLVLAFAHPFIRQNILPTSRPGEITVVAIDNSLSMRSAGELDQAKRDAKSVIGALTPGQRAQVVAIGQRVQVMSEVSDDHSALNAGIDAIEGTDARTSFGELSRWLRATAQSLKLPFHAHLYSDMQHTGMPSNFNDLRLAADIRLDAHPLIKKQTPNFAVENIVAPGRVYDGKKNRVLATVVGFGTQKTTRTVTLSLNGRTVESKTAEIPENGRAAVEFLSLEVPYGRNKGEIKVDSGDSLAGDDTFYFSVERADPRHALFVHEADNGRFGAMDYFKAALAASGQSAFEIDGITPDQTANVSPGKYAFVVLSDIGSLPGPFENELRNYVRTGGSVLISLGGRAVARMKVPVSDDHIEATRYSGREGERFQAVSWLDTSHPSVLKNDRWDDVKFYQAIRIAPGNARVVARLGDQTPLLIDQSVGSGHILVFASTFDNVANDFPVHTSFVPFIEQTARYLGKLEAGASSVLVGSFGELRETKETGTAVDVVDPKGDRVLSLADAAKAQNIQYTMSGFYDVRRPNGRNELVAVNADRHESDLSPASAEDLKLWQSTANSAAENGPGGAAATQKPISLWWYVMLLVLVLAVAESVLGNQHLAVDKEAA